MEGAKGILKKSSEVLLEGNSEHAGIKWDEEVIQEHDKERGKHMKIDEPKTPYNLELEDEAEEDQEPDSSEILEIKKHLSEAEENALKNAQLNEKSLELLNSKLTGTDNKLRDEDDEDLTEAEIKKRADFKKKMKAHYKGEFNAAALLKKKYS